MMKNVLFPKTREEKLLSTKYFSKTAKATKPAEPEVSTKLSEDEIQSYIDILLEASPPTPKGQGGTDFTRKILEERYGIKTNA